MKKAERLATARANVAEALNLEDVGAVQVGNSEYSVPVCVDGKDMFVNITLVCKADGYDADEVRKDYLDDIAEKEAEAKRKAEKQAKKSKK